MALRIALSGNAFYREADASSCLSCCARQTAFHSPAQSFTLITRQAGGRFSDTGACSPKHSRLKNRGDAGLAVSQDRGQYRSYEYLPGSARPEVRKEVYDAEV
jgi:hypothetical protein